MKLVLQRVTEGSVTIEGKVKGAIGRGFVALVGFGPDDDETVLTPMADKMLNLRVFEDGNGKMNLSLLDVGGSVLSISQFTLYADCRHGRRPATDGAPASAARPNPIRRRSFMMSLTKLSLLKAWTCKPASLARKCTLKYLTTAR